MKKFLINFSLPIFISFHTGCGNLTSEVENKLNELKNKTNSLDSMINQEVDKVLTLDSIIHNESEKVKQLDSLINKNSSKLDSISNDKVNRLERIIKK
jgi:peptidoglycan hydrolase CwlO-like protein